MFRIAYPIPNTKKKKLHSFEIQLQTLQKSMGLLLFNPCVAQQVRESLSGLRHAESLGFESAQTTNFYQYISPRMDLFSTQYIGPYGKIVLHPFKDLYH